MIKVVALVEFDGGVEEVDLLDEEKRKKLAQDITTRAFESIGFEIGLGE